MGRQMKAADTSAAVCISQGPEDGLEPLAIVSDRATKPNDNRRDIVTACV